MDSPLIPDKQYLFAYCITDGALDDMTEAQRVLAIKSVLEERDHNSNETK